jgi:hypothetical protein
MLDWTTVSLLWLCGVTVLAAHGIACFFSCNASSATVSFVTFAQIGLPVQLCAALKDPEVPIRRNAAFSIGVLALKARLFLNPHLVQS